MAKATITFEDLDDGALNVSLEFDPPIENQNLNKPGTPAQALAIEVMGEVNGIYDEEV